jgi:PTS system nitrogen regulatory IIA component
MLISDLLSPERIRFDVKSSSKKRLLELISEELARNSDEFTKREIFESICARERLGSTGLGKGVAIPHGRIKGSQHVEASFIRLKKPLPFDAVDGQPVDLLFCLAVPEDCGEDHLKLLAQVAELFSDSELLQKLRQAEDAGTLMQLLSGARH